MYGVTGPAAKPTRTDEVHARLHADILKGDLRPGQQLTFPQLSSSYGASIGVIREALIRLTGQGLVRSQPHHGFQVIPLTSASYAELTDAREELEVLVLRRAITDGDLAWESRAVAAHHLMAQTPYSDQAHPDRPTDAYLIAHAEFHLTLLDGCANRHLYAMTASLREQTELYRRWSRPDPDYPDHPTDPALAAEHRELLDAALARNPDHAEAVLRRHIDRTRHLHLHLEP
jgi:DNA-binding GntR family transcriptional regulator